MTHNASTLGAAIAYYSLFSIGPLILIAITVAGLVYGQEIVRGQVLVQLSTLLGEQGSKAIASMLADAGKPAEGVFATFIGAGTLIFAAIGVVVQLKGALNTVWDVKSPSGAGISHFFRTYAVSLAGVLSLGFLLLISLLLTIALSAVGKMLVGAAPEAALQATSLVATFAMTTGLFAMMFKWLPDIAIGWREVLPGSILTAGLFEIGKFLIGFYIGKQGFEINLRRGSFAGDRPHLGLLLSSTRVVRCRVHARIFGSQRPPEQSTTREEVRRKLLHEEAARTHHQACKLLSMPLLALTLTRLPCGYFAIEVVGLVEILRDACHASGHN